MKKVRRFYKMHALGNDYIFFDCFSEAIACPEEAAIRFSDRRRSIGGDGVILLERSEKADAKMRIFNADGSEAEICGNGLRCAGKWLRDLKGVKKTRLKIETGAGVKTLRLYQNDEGVTENVCADMGTPVFAPEKIPVLLPAGTDGKIVRRPVAISGEKFEITCVSVGNPHCVTFSENAFEKFGVLGEKTENASIFPKRINAEFVKIRGKNDFEVRVYERGSGETYACGSGACATVAAAIENGFAEKNADVTVRLKGGSLTVREEAKNGTARLYLTGEARFVFTGEIEL